MDIPQPYFPAAGAVLAALITGTFTFVNLLTSKDQKTSDFRQQWIDSFRADLSEFTGAVSHLCSLWVYSKGSSHDHTTFQESILKSVHDNPELVTQAITSRTRLLLRINPKEHSEFVQRLDNLYNHFSGDTVPDSIETVENAETALISEAQRLLKKEWKRVKRGEPSFYITKYVALTLVIVACVTAGVAWRGGWGTPSGVGTAPKQDVVRSTLPDTGQSRQANPAQAK